MLPNPEIFLLRMNRELWGHNQGPHCQPLFSIWIFAFQDDELCLSSTGAQLNNISVPIRFHRPLCEKVNAHVASTMVRAISPVENLRFTGGTSPSHVFVALCYTICDRRSVATATRCRLTIDDSSLSHGVDMASAARGRLLSILVAEVPLSVSALADSVVDAFS